MTRCLLSACVGAALVTVLIVPAHGIAKPPDLPEDGTFTAAPAASPPAPLFRLRPTARRTLVGSLLFGIHPVLVLVPTESILDAPCDHPQPRTEDDVLSDIPREPERGRSEGRYDAYYDIVGRPTRAGDDVLSDVPPDFFSHRPVVFKASQYGDWFSWLLAHWTARQQPPTPEQNDGYVYPVGTGMDFAYRAVQDGAASENETPAPAIEVLPMPHEEADITCPYLRQQMIDHHACQIADPEIGRDVLDNLERLKEADNLLELAKELARDGFLGEAMVCCDQAAKLCPGSPCAERAVDTLHELALGIVPPATDTEEAAEQQAEASSSEPGVEQLVGGLMKACHLLMSQGMQLQAAELARQAYALDPQRVVADPLIYKMHLLAESPAGSTEESEPPTCPYCPRIGKPIREIVPEKKKSEDGSQTKP